MSYSGDLAETLSQEGWGAWQHPRDGGGQTSPRPIGCPWAPIQPCFRFWKMKTETGLDVFPALKAVTGDDLGLCCHLLPAVALGDTRTSHIPLPGVASGLPLPHPVTPSSGNVPALAVPQPRPLNSQCGHRYGTPSPGMLPSASWTLRGDPGQNLPREPWSP